MHAITDDEGDDVAVVDADADDNDDNIQWVGWWIKKYNQIEDGKDWQNGKQRLKWMSVPTNNTIQYSEINSILFVYYIHTTTDVQKNNYSKLLKFQTHLQLKSNFDFLLSQNETAWLRQTSIRLCCILTDYHCHYATRKCQ